MDTTVIRKILNKTLKKTFRLLVSRPVMASVGNGNKTFRKVIFSAELYWFYSWVYGTEPAYSFSLELKSIDVSNVM